MSNETESLVLESLQTITQKIGSIDERLDSIDSRIDLLEDKFNNLNKKADNVETKMARDIRNLELTVENEIRPNIDKVVEIHAFLMHLFDEALSYNKETAYDEVKVALKLNYLDSEIRKIKANCPV